MGQELKKCMASLQKLVVYIETWHRAANIKSETGKNSYVNCFTDTVTKGSDLHQQREHIKQEYINLNELCCLCK